MLLIFKKNMQSVKKNNTFAIGGFAEIDPLKSEGHFFTN